MIATPGDSVGRIESALRWRGSGSGLSRIRSQSRGRTAVARGLLPVGRLFAKGDSAAAPPHRGRKTTFGRRVVVAGNSGPRPLLMHVRLLNRAEYAQNASRAPLWPPYLSDARTGRFPALGCVGSTQLSALHAMEIRELRAGEAQSGYGRRGPRGRSAALQRGGL